MGSLRAWKDAACWTINIVGNFAVVDRGVGGRLVGASFDSARIRACESGAFASGAFDLMEIDLALMHGGA